jgi:hypothetical protein
VQGGNVVEVVGYEGGGQKGASDDVVDDVVVTVDVVDVMMGTPQLLLGVGSSAFLHCFRMAFHFVRQRF